MAIEATVPAPTIEDHRSRLAYLSGYLEEQEIKGHQAFEAGDPAFPAKFSAWERRNEEYMALAKKIGEPE